MQRESAFPIGPPKDRRETESERSASARREIADLYTKYGAAVLGRCRYLLRDEEAARDASQEVFVRVMRSLATFRSEASPLTWILKIATNHCLNVIAAKKAKWKDRFREYAQHREEEEIGSRAIDPERSQIVRALLSRLDLETQQVAVHYYVDEMTQEEIAAQLGRSLPTIRKRIEKFLRIARKELSDDST